MLSSVDIRRLETFFAEAERVCIVVHTHPDGDALGSGAALLAYLSGCRGLQASLLLPDPPGTPLEFLLPEKGVLTLPGDAASAREHLDECDLLVCLDMNGFSRAGDLVEKVKIFDAGLDDRAIEMCKYVTKQEAGKPGMDLKFLRLDGADNELVFTYPAAGQMELLAVGFNVYEDCRGIIARNPHVAERARGLAVIDEAWVASLLR